MPSRRHFMQWAGAGAAASLVTGRGFAQAPSNLQTSSKAPSKRAYELGLASYTLLHFPLDKACVMSDRVGLKHFCLHPRFLPTTTPLDQVAAAAAKIKAAKLDLYAAGVVYTSKPEDVNLAFEYAKTLGVRVIVGVPPYKLLPLVNEKVQQYDIRFAIHNHGPGDKAYPTPDIAYEKIKTLDQRIGLCIDIGHTMRNGVDPSQAVEQFADRLIDIHCKDVNAATPAGRCVEAGRGVIDLPKFFRTLDKVGYTGFVSFEYEKDGNDPLPGLAETVGYARGIMAAI